MSKNITKFNFPSVYSVSMEEIDFLQLKLNKQMESELSDLSAYLEELEVLQYQASFPY